MEGTGDVEAKWPGQLNRACELPGLAEASGLAGRDGVGGVGTEGQTEGQRERRTEQLEDGVST